MNVAIATAQTVNPNGSSTSEGQSAGISFAIPLATIESRIDQLIAGKEIASGFLGVGPASGRIDEVDRRGVKIGQLTAGGAAEKAGLKKGDVIAEDRRAGCPGMAHPAVDHQVRPAGADRQAQGAARG